VNNLVQANFSKHSTLRRKKLSVKMEFFSSSCRLLANVTVIKIESNEIITVTDCQVKAEDDTVNSIKT